jgi:hypothetical protein
MEGRPLQLPVRSRPTFSGVELCPKSYRLQGAEEEWERRFSLLMSRIRQEYGSEIDELVEVPAEAQERGVRPEEVVLCLVRSRTGEVLPCSSVSSSQTVRSWTVGRSEAGTPLPSVREGGPSVEVDEVEVPSDEEREFWGRQDRQPDYGETRFRKRVCSHYFVEVV